MGARQVQLKQIVTWQSQRLESEPGWHCSSKGDPETVCVCSLQLSVQNSDFWDSPAPTDSVSEDGSQKCEL